MALFGYYLNNALTSKKLHEVGEK